MSRPASVTLLRGIAATLLFTACQRSSAPDPAPLPSAAAESTAVCEAQRALDQMDERIAVPLVPMMANHQRRDMRDHLLAVQEIVVAASTGDFVGVEHAAGRIGFSAQMGQTCTHMGAGASGFTELALHFHHTADTIAAAARLRDTTAVLKALGTTLQTCTGCHAAFRQSVVDEGTWSRLTAALAPEGDLPRH
ncbi:MAG: cytochrome c [Deltaproteobacteria bacterium]